MRAQYAAIDDLERVAGEIMKIGNGRFALVFDPKHGWCATDEIEVSPVGDGSQTLRTTITTFSDWHRDHIAHAVSTLGTVRFLGPSSTDKLFRKEPPPHRKDEAHMPGATSPPSNPTSRKARGATVRDGSGKPT